MKVSTSKTICHTALFLIQFPAFPICYPQKSGFIIRIPFLPLVGHPYDSKIPRQAFANSAFIKLVGGWEYDLMFCPVDLNFVARLLVLKGPNPIQVRNMLKSVKQGGVLLVSKRKPPRERNEFVGLSPKFDQVCFRRHNFAA